MLLVDSRVDLKFDTGSLPSARLYRLSLPSVTWIVVDRSLMRFLPPSPSITSCIKTRSGSATFMSAIHLRYLKIHLRQWWWGGGWEWWGWWWQLSSAYVCCHVGMSWLGCWTSAHFSPTSSQRPLPIIHSDRYCPGVWSLDRKPVRGPTGLNERAKLMPVRTLENWSEAS